MFKLNGKPPSRRRASSAMLLGPMLSATLLAGCATHSTATTTETICRPWKPLGYASKTRTSPRFAGPALVGDLRVHNLTGQRLGCWK
jgi:hypothetical protein